MPADKDSLIEFVNAVSGEAYLKIEESLGDGFVRLRISEAERRQAQHDIRSFEDIVVELLRNSRDARSSLIFVATGKDGDVRTMTVIDDGVGVPASMHEKIFEPRVTSKLESMVMDKWGVHGRGMALFSVRSNVSSVRISASDDHKGTALTVVADATMLSERSDQSTWPCVEKDEHGALRVVRGPHNILRRVVEFACEHEGVDVYVGSPAEVLTTLYGLGRAALSASDLLFCEDASRLPVWQRPATASDASELTELSAQMGLSISERTAHRILAGELAPLESVLCQVCSEEAPEPETASPDIYRDRRGLSVHPTDLADFRRELVAAFDTLAETYYLHLKGEPRVTVGRNEIRVRFEIEKEE